jgi:hypothetical protein
VERESIRFPFLFCGRDKSGQAGTDFDVKIAQKVFLPIPLHMASNSHRRFCFAETLLAAEPDDVILSKKILAFCLNFFTNVS